MTEQIISQEQIDKSEHRESSRLRNQPRKNYKLFIPQSTLKRKIITKQRQITRKRFSKNRNAFSESETKQFRRTL